MSASPFRVMWATITPAIKLRVRGGPRCLRDLHVVTVRERPSDERTPAVGDESPGWGPRCPWPATGRTRPGSGRPSSPAGWCQPAGYFLPAGFTVSRHDATGGVMSGTWMVLCSLMMAPVASAMGWPLRSAQSSH